MQWVMVAQWYSHGHNSYVTRLTGTIGNTRFHISHMVSTNYDR